MPLLRKTLINTVVIEIIKPAIKPTRTINSFCGLTGIELVCAVSIILTLPIALDLAILSSCCLLRSCIYTACPDSTSLFNLRTSC